MVSTLDSESNNPSSNLGRTFFNFIQNHIIKIESFLSFDVFLQKISRLFHRNRIIILHKSTRLLFLLFQITQHLNWFRQNEVFSLYLASNSQPLRENIWTGLSPSYWLGNYIRSLFLFLLRLFLPLEFLLEWSWLYGNSLNSNWLRAFLLKWELYYWWNNVDFWLLMLGFEDNN
jgi:hypothetical protein